ncbi:uncharacterized protein EV154DRAFT_410312 [Mucor mucedo]|uniref:uncharacterized protein n=1 Tax=Mucor mucedo TaxID=29922 RepID=UPI00221E4DF4|nr:uncharacterized protein EV154DRAFT_410312 [Mucor mucedo]KAI7896975.1 hypothetical protein EV154DRAFT_410312 [Mucor mucedo]
MKLNERSICNVADSVDIIQLLQKSPKRLIDCHEFIKSVFSPQSITHDITLQEINRIRALFRNRKN